VQLENQSDTTLTININVRGTKKSIVNKLIGERKNIKSDFPKNSRLYQNYPNPFNPSTTINYSINKPGFVQIMIYYEVRKLVRILVNRYQTTSECSIVWDGKDKGGRLVSSGIYYYSLKSGNNKLTTKRMLILK
jgi:hypothetical protein